MREKMEIYSAKNDYEQLNLIISMKGKGYYAVGFSYFNEKKKISFIEADNYVYMNEEVGVLSTLCRSKKYLKNELQDSTELAEQLKKIYLEKNPAKQLLLFNMEK